MNVEFECVVCGQTATASVSEADADAMDRPLRTLNDCDRCDMETIWLET